MGMVLRTWIKECVASSWFLAKELLQSSQHRWAEMVPIEDVQRVELSPQNSAQLSELKYLL